MTHARSRGFLAGAAARLALTLGALPVSAQELTIFWAEWDPANYLQELVNQYTDETGVKVTVQTTPWPDFQTKAFMELNAHGDSYDLVVGDSQWLGAGATEGHYVELTDFVKEHELTKMTTPASMTYYAEYPKGSGRYWAVPLEGDAIGWAYRKDWFEDPSEMKAFKEKYGYDLAAPEDLEAPARYRRVLLSARSQTRYGVAIYTETPTTGWRWGTSRAVQLRR